MIGEFFKSVIPFGENFFLSSQKKEKLRLVNSAIDEAQEWCLNLKVDYSLWKGVDYLTHRQSQIKESMNTYLTGFKSKIESTNEVRWTEFRSLAQQNITQRWKISPKHPEFNWETSLENVMEAFSSETNFGGAVNEDHAPFLRFLDQQCSHNKSNFTWAAVAKALTYQKASQIAADFLTEHVGYGHYRNVTPARAGFDLLPYPNGHKNETTCPVAMAPGVAMWYFALMAAQYIKMRAIQEQYWDTTLFAYPKSSEDEPV